MEGDLPKSKLSQSGQMSNGTASSYSPRNGNLIEALKTILQSQVGGWIIACVLFAFLARWVIKDRAEVYSDLAKLRETAMPAILENRRVTLESQIILNETKKISSENQEILQEIRSMMNLPMQNQRTLEDILQRLKKTQNYGE